MAMEELKCKDEVLLQSLQQTQQEADEHACAAQELLQLTGTTHAQLKPCSIVLVLQATSSVVAAIVVAENDKLKEAVSGHATTA